MTVFAHNGVEHAGSVESAAHNMTGILLVSIAAIILMVLAVWILNHKSSETDAEEEAEE